MASSTRTRAIFHREAFRSRLLERVVTIVHYKHWTGRLYFNVIRPVHHFVVSGMARAGARGLP
jgi:hypothetical protein